MPAAVQRDGGFGVLVRIADRAKELTRNEPQNFPFSGRQRGDLRFVRAGCGNDGVMVADLCAVANLFGV